MTGSFVSASMTLPETMVFWDMAGNSTPTSRKRRMICLVFPGKIDSANLAKIFVQAGGETRNHQQCMYEKKCFRFPSFLFVFNKITKLGKIIIQPPHCALAVKSGECLPGKAIVHEHVFLILLHFSQ